MTVLSRLLPVTRHTAPTHRRIHQTTLVRFFASSFRDSAAQLRSAFYTPTARADALAYCEKLLSDHAATRGSGSILSEKPVEQDTRAVPASAESHEGENSSEDSSTEKGSKKSAGVIPVRSFEAPLWNLPLIVEGLPDAPRVTERAELLSRVPEKLARSPLKVSAAFLSGLKLHGAAALAAEADGEAQFVMAARRNAALVVWEVEEETEKLVGQVYLALAEGCAAVNVVLMGGSAPHTSEVLGAVFQGLPVDVVCCRRGGDTSSDTSAELPEGLRTEALVDVLKEVSVIASNDSRLKKELMTKAVMEGENFALLNGAGGNAGHVGCGAALGFLTAGIRRRAPLEWRDKKDDFHRYGEIGIICCKFGRNLSEQNPLDLHALVEKTTRPRAPGVNTPPAPARRYWRGLAQKRAQTVRRRLPRIFRGRVRLRARLCHHHHHAVNLMRAQT